MISVARIGPSVGLLLDNRVNHLADKDRVVAVLNRLLQRALDIGRHALQHGCAGAAGFVGFAVNRIAVLLNRLEEGKGRALLSLAQDIQGKTAGFFHDLMRSRVALHADHDQRRVKGGLGDPVDGCGSNLAVFFRGQDIQAIRNHA